MYLCLVDFLLISLYYNLQFVLFEDVLDVMFYAFNLLRGCVEGCETIVPIKGEFLARKFSTKFQHEGLARRFSAKVLARSFSTNVQHEDLARTFSAKVQRDGLARNFSTKFQHDVLARSFSANNQHKVLAQTFSTNFQREVLLFCLVYGSYVPLFRSRVTSKKLIFFNK